MMIISNQLYSSIKRHTKNLSIIFNSTLKFRVFIVWFFAQILSSQSTEANRGCSHTRLRLVFIYNMYRALLQKPANCLIWIVRHLTNGKFPHNAHNPRGYSASPLAANLNWRLEFTFLSIPNVEVFLHQFGIWQLWKLNIKEQGCFIHLQWRIQLYT